MRKKPKKILFAFSISITMVLAMITAQVYYNLPKKISFMQYDNSTCPFSSFVQGKVSDPSLVVSQSSDTRITNLENGSTKFDTNNVGVYDVNLSLFGWIPIKQVSVEVREPMRVVVGGNLLGLKMDTDGVVVVGLSHVINKQSQKLTPMENAGIHIGDQIEELNGTSVDSIHQLVDVVERSQGVDIPVVYKHNGAMKKTTVTPVMSRDGTYKLGAWVRDSSAGIGTMTFYNPQNGSFGALGHAICDVDTGETIKIAGGTVLPCEIRKVTKSEKGSPGRLEGSLLAPSQYGSILSNIDTGIYGKINTGDFNDQQTMEVGSSFSVKEGPATILCSLDGKTIHSYQIMIEKKSVNTVSSKGMIIKVTDPALLEKTGGIIQGMSGSPIIQNNKLVGAVTHVFINDPTRGYGIFIENMLDDCYQTCGE